MKFLTVCGRRALRSALAASLSALACVTVPASAAIIASDFFNYSDGEVVGKSGGFGWGVEASWTGDTAITGVVSGELQFTEGTNQNAAERVLSSTFTGPELFISFYLTVAANTIVDNTEALLWRPFGTFADPNDLTNGYPNLGVWGTDVNDFLARSFDGSAGGVVSAQTIPSSAITTRSYDQTWRVVGRLSRSGAYGTAYDKFEAWLNPSSASLGSPNKTDTTLTKIINVTGIGFRSLRWDAGDELRIDNLLLSTTWAEALEVPEPGVPGLIGLGLSLAALARRRRSPA